MSKAAKKKTKQQQSGCDDQLVFQAVTAAQRLREELGASPYLLAFAVGSLAPIELGPREWTVFVDRRHGIRPDCTIVSNSCWSL